jgi:hypothetical protein
MAITLNGTSGINTPSPMVLTGSTSGSITLAAPDVAGSSVITFPTGTGTASINGLSSNIVSGTAQTAPPPIPQYFDFTGIPSWVKRITVMLSGVSSNSTNLFQIQLGTTSSIETSSYNGTSGWFGATNLAFSTGMSSGFLITAAGGPTFTGSGVATISLLNSSTNTWAIQSTIARYDSGNNFMHVAGGTKSLASTLTRIRITTVGGTDTFDTGTINILYE